VGKEARSLDNIFMFRESEKSLKKTPGGSFFMYPYRFEKEIKSLPGCILMYLQARERTKTKLIMPLA
jgi:hypothetical protein